MHLKIMFHANFNVFILFVEMNNRMFCKQFCLFKTINLEVHFKIQTTLTESLTICIFYKAHCFAMLSMDQKCKPRTAQRHVAIDR